MISVEIARRLREAGLEWVPREGDRFVIPDRDLEGHVFSISEMTIDVEEAPGGRRIFFNGAVEWALDSILEREVVWLPSESQLRDRLGVAFHSLEREGGTYHCTVGVGEELRSFAAANPADAYGRALLDLLEDSELFLRVLLDEL